MAKRFYIKKIIRDDGVNLVFDRKEIYLTGANTDLSQNGDIDSTDVEYTETNGGEMVAQRVASAENDYSGAIISRTTPYWALRSQIKAFFVINHCYRVIFAKIDGTMFAKNDFWLSKNLQIPVGPNENYSPFTFSLKNGNMKMYEYAEDNSDNEIFANSVQLPLISSSTGGQVWDSVGQVYDAVGSVWEGGSGGVQNVNIASISRIYPVWTVKGLSVNPTLQNNTTDTVAKYNGTVGAGQTLVVDFAAGTATLDGAIVSRNLSGVVNFNPGQNVAGFNADGGTTTKSTIQWNNVIG